MEDKTDGKTTEDKSFDFAHRNTDTDVRRSGTAMYNRYEASTPDMTERIEAIRKDCASREIPVSSEETLAFICALARIKAPENILELGTATGVSGAALLDAVPETVLTTVERSKDFLAEAMYNLQMLGISDRAYFCYGDAGNVILDLLANKQQYDFIFLDCAKVQYIKYLPTLKKLLRPGGVLVADDVLIYGWATGENEVPPKRHMLAQHIQEYIDAVTADEDLRTVILDIGDGMAVSVLKS
ncbi:MAG: O-methyltransferase [Clostridia bacterium]|nr:O-methyltransferase [Clostridia bacterium]